MVQLTHLFGMDAAMDEWIDSDQTDMYHGQRRMMQLLTWKNPGSQLVGLLSHLSPCLVNIHGIRPGDEMSDAHLQAPESGNRFQGRFVCLAAP
jgi:hypothetical protein